MLSSPRMSRRTLAKTAVWVAPAAALSIAAPAVAASRCIPRTLNWTSFPISGGKRDGQVTVGGGTATLSRDVTTDHSETFTTDPSQGNLLRLRSETPGRSNDPATTKQTLSLRFSMDVHNLALTVYDLDLDLRSGILSSRYEDRVHITSASTFHSTKGTNIIGSGTESDPFRMNPAVGNGNLPGGPLQSQSQSFKVDLHWDFVPAGEQISIEYIQGAWNEGIGFGPTPTIWISNPTFCA